MYNIHTYIKAFWYHAVPENLLIPIYEVMLMTANPNTNRFQKEKKNPTFRF